MASSSTKSRQAGLVDPADSGVAAGPPSRRGSGTALSIAILSLLVIAAVWGFQKAGYAPCDLCLIERYPYYVGVPVALAAAVFATIGPRSLAVVAFAALILIFVASAGLAAYHVGVEAKWWAGPSGCTGTIASAPSVNDFLKQLDTVKVVRCDAPALLVAGLSLAAWNVPASLLLALLSWMGFRTVRPARRR